MTTTRLRAICGSTRPCDRVQIAEHTLVPPLSWSDRRRWAPEPVAGPTVHPEEPVMKPLIYGYLRVPDDLDDHQIRRMERGLRDLAQAEGFCFATTFHEHQPGYQGAFQELTRELQRADAHHVVVPSLGHLSLHPLLRNMMLAYLAREADAHVWVVAP
ncbi:MAG: recombinase family protein [Pseudonocardia sp.]